VKTKLDEISDAYYKHDPAFPSTTTDGFGCVTTMGLSRREYFAAMALQGLVTDKDLPIENAVKISVRCADLLLEELNKDKDIKNKMNGDK